MRCSCEALDVPHHHVASGTYACAGPERCRRCEAYDSDIWRDVKATKRRYGMTNN